jgi:hypothetical protein
MRLIDADALYDALKAEQKWVVRCGDKHNEGYTYDQVHFAIDNAPTIEPKQGEWIIDKVWYTAQGIYNIDFKCSECELKPRYTSDYCPQCGAKMKTNRLCQMCNDYVRNGMPCAKNYLVYDFSLAKDNCENNNN